MGKNKILYKNTLVVRPHNRSDLLFVTLVITTGFGFLYIFALHDILIMALKTGKSAYLLKSPKYYGSDLGKLARASYSLWGSGIITYTVACLTCRIRRPFYIRSLWIHISSYFIIAFLTGDRGQLFVVLIGVFIAYNLLRNRLDISWKHITCVVLFIFIGTTIRELRHLNLDELLTLNLHDFINIRSITTTIFFSGENFAPYLAMPFLTHGDFSLTYGKSFLYLGLSLIPRFLAPFRPISSFTYGTYVHYAGIENLRQGLCFHQAADWYMNFGFPGVILGGVILGYLMRRIENSIYSSKHSLFCITVFASLYGWIPQLIRNPIECYRAFAYEYCGIPFLMFVVFPHVAKQLVKHRS